MRTALITGITGQDGAYLAQLLLEKGYRVVGAHRRSSSSTWRLEALGISDDVELTPLELLEQDNIRRCLTQVKPDEIYNLAAQTFVQASFDMPIYTGECNGIGVARLLEAVREACPEARFYQASTSEMFGKVQQTPQSETTPFYPRSPYGVAKLYAHWMAVNYREAHNLFACCGILFNHESPLRGPEFVTRKITQGLASYVESGGPTLVLGNLGARRDWGFAGDYVDGMFRMLQADRPDDYVLATGHTATVREFCNLAAQALDITLEWSGEGLDEIATHKGKTVIKVNPKHYRPAEVDLLLGNPTKAQTKLGWKAKTELPELARMMARSDYDLVHQSIA
jgi:GDPmannose 4,6-dehydratase